MQRLLSIKLITQSSRNFVSSSSSESVLSFSKPNPFLVHSHFYSSSKPYLTGKLTGFVSNPVLSNQFLPRTLFKNQSKGLVNGRGIGFISAQFSRSYYRVRHPTPLGRLRQQWKLWISRIFTPSGMVLGLIGTNVAVFMLWRLAGQNFMAKHFTVSLENIRNFRLHTLITSGFSHVDATHLFFNMIGLYFFGSNIGRIFGPEFLLGLYLSGAFAGSIFFLVQKYLENSSKKNQLWGINYSKASALGASGATNAIMLLDIFLFPTKTVLFEFFIPVPAIFLGVFIIGKDVLRILEGDSQISGAAHLGGAAVAAFTWLRIRKGHF